MAYLKGQKPVYYYVLKGHPNILADERDKKKLLDIVLGIQQVQEFEIYAFCITNEEFCLMLSAANQAEINKGVRQLSAEFSAWRLGGRPSARAKRAAEQLTVVLRKKLRSQQEIKLQCREIHFIPVSKGYVTQIRNYWWSSYQTYLGYYDWKQVNCSAVLRIFSEDCESARRQLRRYHGFLE